MFKIIPKQKTHFLSNYNNVLKNNYLKNIQKNKQYLFKNFILLSIKNKKLIELYNNKNKNSLFSIDYKTNFYYTIDSKYKDNFLIKNNLNYRLLSYFSKIIFKKQSNSIYVKGLFLTTFRKRGFLSYFGRILSFHKHDLVDVPPGFWRQRHLSYIQKCRKLRLDCNKYRLKHLIFKIDTVGFFFKKKKLSRKSYIPEALERIKKEAIKLAKKKAKAEQKANARKERKTKQKLIRQNAEKHFL